LTLEPEVENKYASGSNYSRKQVPPSDEYGRLKSTFGGVGDAYSGSYRKGYSAKAHQPLRVRNRCKLMKIRVVAVV